MRLQKLFLQFHFDYSVMTEKSNNNTQPVVLVLVFKHSNLKFAWGVVLEYSWYFQCNYCNYCNWGHQHSNYTSQIGIQNFSLISSWSIKYCAWIKVARTSQVEICCFYYVSPAFFLYLTGIVSYPGRWGTSPMFVCRVAAEGLKP